MRISDRARLPAVLLALLLAAAPAAHAQSYLDDYPEGRFVYPPPGPQARSTLSTIFVGTITAGILVDSYYSWWRNAEEPFHFYDSPWFAESRGIDRIGHLYGSYFFYHTFRDILLWGGTDPETARWWGVGLAAFEALSIEIGDAMSPFGFDPKDFLFNMFGIGYALLQEEVPMLRNFPLKFSYWSDYGLRSPANFTTDYDAMTVWMGVDMCGLLGRDSGWPAWLGFAVGYSVDEQATRSEVLLSFDLNLEAFDTGNNDLRLVQSMANKLHVPLPGVKFTQGKPPTWSPLLLR